MEGAATGIGAATVKTLSKHGAKVVLGDINKEAADALCKDYSGLSFVHCDVSKYDDIYNLFKTAHEEHGRIDHAVSCAGIFETGNWFDPKLTIDTVKNDSGNLRTLDVNILGTLHFARVAAVFLREGRQKDQDKTITLLSSVNAFRESPGLYIYQVSTLPALADADLVTNICYRPASTQYKALCAPLERSYTDETVFE